MQTWRDKLFSDNFAKIHFISTIVTFFDSDSPNLVIKLWVLFQQNYGCYFNNCYFFW